MLSQEYARLGGLRSQQSGRGHRWTAEEAKRWGQLGGQCTQEANRRKHPRPPVIPSERPPRDPVSGRLFDSYFDDIQPCGCVVFYRGGRVTCQDHGGQGVKIP